MKCNTNLHAVGRYTRVCTTALIALSATMLSGCPNPTGGGDGGGSGGGGGGSPDRYIAQSDKLTPNATIQDPVEGFGHAVAAAPDHLVIGNPHDDDGSGTASPEQNEGSALATARDSSGDFGTRYPLPTLSISETDWYGYAVDTDGDFAVASAPAETIDPASDPAVYYDTGRVTVLVGAADGTWTRRLTLELGAEDMTGYTYFGYDVAIDGNTIIAGAPSNERASGDNTNKGLVSIVSSSDGFSTYETTVVQPSEVAGSDDFGYAVALEGDVAVVGAPATDPGTGVAAGAAYLLERTAPGSWNSVQFLPPSGDEESDGRFGYSVAISGDTIAVGAPGTGESGSVYLYTRTSGGSLSDATRISSPDPAQTTWFANEVELYEDYLFVGAPFHAEKKPGGGGVYVFRRQADGSWKELRTLFPSEPKSDGRFGARISATRDYLAVGHNTGVSEVEAVYVFE